MAIYLLVIFYKGHLGSKILLFEDKDILLASKIKTITTPNEKVFFFGTVNQTIHIYVDSKLANHNLQEIYSDIIYSLYFG